VHIKTVLVTRIEKFTNNHVTATVIAKNCAPTNPHVPKCKKKFKDALIRERPDNDASIPLIISTAALVPAIPPAIYTDEKRIVNDEVPVVAQVREKVEEGSRNNNTSVQKSLALNITQETEKVLKQVKSILQ